MSENLIGDFTRGDSLQVKCALAVDGQAENLAGASIQLVLKPLGSTAASITVTDAPIPAGPDATAGIHYLAVLPDQTLVPPGRYTAFLVRVRGSTDRFTFHREQLQVLTGAQ